MNNIANNATIQKNLQDTDMLTMINDKMYHQVGLYDRNVRNIENLNNRYWIGQANYNQIMNNEQMRYNFFKYKEQSILCDINRLNLPIRLWRYKDKFYYRPSQFSELIVGDEKTIALEISSRYGNINIHFVSDLNDALSYKKTEMKIDTTYIAINSILVVDDEVFDFTRTEEVFINQQGLFSRNLLSYTPYLLKRSYNYKLKVDSTSTARYFIENMTTLQNFKFLANRFGNFFKHLVTSEAIV